MTAQPKPPDKRGSLKNEAAEDGKSGYAAP